MQRGRERRRVNEELMKMSSRGRESEERMRRMWQMKSSDTTHIRFLLIWGASCWAQSVWRTSNRTTFKRCDHTEAHCKQSHDLQRGSALSGWLTRPCDRGSESVTSSVISPHVWSKAPNSQLWHISAEPGGATSQSVQERTGDVLLALRC